VASTCLEPGCETIFQQASPTFKKRFMYMSGIPNEDAFDKFRQTLTWEGHIDKIKAPYLCLAGEADELSPLEHTERMFKVMKSPRQLVIYADSRHSVGGVPAAIPRNGSRRGSPACRSQANAGSSSPPAGSRRAHWRKHRLWLDPSVPIPKFASLRGTLVCELRNQRDTSNL
jgi:hypothetical protein